MADDKNKDKDKPKDNDDAGGAPGAGEKDKATTTTAAIKVEVGTKVTFWQVLNGPSTRRVTGTVTKVHKSSKPDELPRVDIRWQHTDGPRVAERIKAGTGEPDAPCWVPA